MMFSNLVKEEISVNKNLREKTNIFYELLGYLFSNNFQKNIFKTESQIVINRYALILENLQIPYDIYVKGKFFNIKTKLNENTIIQDKKLGDFFNKEKQLNKETIEELVKNFKKFFIGIFAASATLREPIKTYELKIFSSKEILEFIQEQMRKMDINLKINGVDKICLYTNEAEEISKVLAFIQANKALLTFEDIRIQKEMNQKVNRIINGKQYNLNKTVDSSVKIIDKIQTIKQSGKFEKLPKQLQEIAQLRVKYPNDSYSELSEKTNRSLSKSGIAYRLKKLEELDLEKL